MPSQTLSSRIPFRRAFPWLIADAATAMAYDTWLGPIYLGAWAGKIGIPAEQLPWLTSLPLLGSVGQLLGFVALSSFARRLPIKWLCISVALLARSLWPFAFLIPLDRMYLAVGGVGVIAALSSMIGLTSTSLWMAWMNGIVPKAFDGRFWGARARGSTAGVLVAHGIAALILSRLAGSAQPEASASAPFAILLALALLSALASTVILFFVKSPDRAVAPARDDENALSTLGLFSRLKDPALIRILVIGAVFQAGISLAGPYFPYYFTHDVGLAPAEVSFWYAMTQIGIASAALFWGRRWDRAYASPSPDPALARIFKICALIIAFSPLPYVIKDAAILRWVGPIEYLINGVGWAGFSIGLNTLLFRAVPGRDASLTALLFSSLTALQGVTGALASVLGARIAVIASGWGGFQFLWVVATGFRVVVALWLVPRLGRIESGFTNAPGRAIEVAHETPA